MFVYIYAATESSEIVFAVFAFSEGKRREQSPTEISFRTGHSKREQVLLINGASEKGIGIRTFLPLSSTSEE